MYRIIQTSLANFVKANFTRSRALEPLFPLYHITPFCNLRCSYCDGLLERSEQGRSQLNTNEVKEVLGILRDKFDYIFITGGEPFIRHDIGEVLHHAKQLNFKRIAINTNSLLLPEKEKCLEDVDQLSISLDSLEEERYDTILGVPGAARKIVQHVLIYAQKQKSLGYTLTVHCVIMPEAIDQAQGVLKFCLDHGIRICLSPMVVDYAPHPALVRDPGYGDFIKELLRLKARTGLISGTPSYFKSIMDFKPCTCYPFLIPRIFPMGELLYPCRPLGEKRHRVNLLEVGSWEKAAKLATASFGDMNQCDRQCWIRCYIEPSLLARRPWRMLPEFVFVRFKQ